MRDHGERRPDPRGEVHGATVVAHFGARAGYGGSPLNRTQFSSHRPDTFKAARSFHGATLSS